MIRGDEGLEKQIQKKKLGLLIGICYLILITALGYTYLNYVRPAEATRMRYVNNNVLEEVYRLEAGTELAQTIQMQSDTFETLGIVYSNFQGNEKDILEVSFADNKNNVMQSWAIQLTEKSIDTNTTIPKTLYLNAKETMHVKDQESYILKIRLKGNVGDYLELNQTDAASVKIIENNKKTVKPVACQILGGLSGGIKWFFVGVSGLIIFSVTVIIILIVRKEKLEKIVVGCVLTFGIIYMFIIPAYAVPDELQHFATAYNVSSKLLGEKFAEAGEAVVLQEQEILCDQGGNIATKERYIEDMKGVLGKTYQNNSEAVMFSSVLDMPGVAYAPQSLGISLARLLNLNGIQIFYMGRLFALMTYAIFVYWAVKIMPFAKMVLFVTALLPMSLQQAMSYSYDMLANALSFFMIAYFFLLIYEKEKIERKDIVILIITTAVLAPIKVVYIVIIGLGVLIPYQKFGSRLKKWICAVGIFLSGIIPILMTRLTSMSGLVESNQKNTNLLGYEVYGASYFIENPFSLIAIFKETTKAMSRYYIDTTIGRYLGWLEIILPEIIVIGFIIVLLVSALRKKSDRDEIVFKEKIWMAILAMGCCVAVCFALLISWTEVGSFVIAGVQGRYFIPVVPLFVILFRTKYITLKMNTEIPVICATVALQCYTILSVLKIVIIR